jgi:hypothetical protein
MHYPQCAVNEAIDDSRVEPCNLGNVTRRTLSLRKNALQIHWEISWSAFSIESKRHLISQVFVTHGQLGINSCTTSIILDTWASDHCLIPLSAIGLSHNLVGKELDSNVYDSTEDIILYLH